jgi:tetratricopeptide (TPR) repeat protein/tRNA A-37 threonylcarbamoyl transferase component Bud32
VRELGAGGMGVVFEAHDPDLDRRVAIKVVRDRNAGSAAGMRLIAEAQAMARLAHPNVVGVHEVGTIDNQVFLVMELVRGDTLAGWLDRHPRPWRDIVGMFVQAGEGLLAAHHAGLVHRDFKPSNVLIDLTGRARVGDFGLARGDDRKALASGSEASAVAGTLAYMAPEQRAGEPVDARADQYAFAISLQQALAPKHAVGSPARRVRSAITRALSIDPDERFATLEVLLGELKAGIRSRRMALVTIGGTLVMAGLAASLVLTQSGSDACADGARLVDGVWSPSARLTQVAKFLQVRPDALVTSASTARLVDDWADRWKLGRKAACAAEGLQRVERLGCLDRGLHELRAQIALWRNADSTVVDHAVRAAAALPQPHACATHPAAALGDTLRGRIAELAALVRSGHPRKAHHGVAELLQHAEAEKNPHARAAALLAAGRIEREAGNLAVAREHFSQAARAAGLASDDKALLDALIEEAVVIIDLGRPRDSLGLLDAADALQTRARLDQSERIALVRGDAYGQAGRAREAIAEITRVLPQIETRALLDPSARMLLTLALGQLAAAQRQLVPDDARKTLERALALDEASYGLVHPEVGKTLHDLGAVELQLELYDAAAERLHRAMRIFVASYGERHPMVGATFMTLASLATSQGQLDEGRRMYLQAQAALTGMLPEDTPHFAAIEQGLGDIARSQDNCEEALPHFERAVRLLEQNGHAENERALQLTNLGYCLAEVGRTAEAKQALLHSIDEVERLRMPKRWLAEPFAALADLERAAGNRNKAIELAQRALDTLTDEKGSDVVALREYIAGQLNDWIKQR